MDTKYAFYSTSKGYRVLGGTAAHFLKADGSVDSNGYVNKIGDTMSGALTFNGFAAGRIVKDVSTLTGGFARNIFELTSTNGLQDSIGYLGGNDSSGNTTLTYGYLGGTAYNTKSAIRWTPDGRVGIGLTSTSTPQVGYALHTAGNTYTAGNIDLNGIIGTVGTELNLQRAAVTRFRTSGLNTVLSSEGSGQIYIRPQGDAVTGGQIIINSTGTITTSSDGNSTQWNTAYTTLSSVPRQGALGGDINSVITLDTRNTNPLPSTDLRRGVWFDFKTSSVIGLTGAGLYSSAITMIPYNDNSGNINTAFRLAQSADEMYFQNYASAGNWGAFRKMWTDKHFSQANINNWNTAFNQQANYIPLSQKGVANGVATLDATVQIPNAQIPQRLQNKVIALGGETADTSFTGLYDRNQLALADKEHTVISVINGAGTFNSSAAGFNNTIFNSKSDFSTITGADATTEVVITITFSSVLSNYGRGLWQPFVQTRLTAGQQFRDIVVEVMDSSNVWYTPAAFNVQNVTLIPNSGLFLFPETQPGTSSIKAVRFKLSNVQTTNGIAYVSNIGFRHVSHSFAPQFPHRGENNTFFGVNTFSQSPIVPPATISNQAVNLGQIVNFMHEDNTRPISSVDLNTYKTQGFYAMSTFTNGPVGAGNYGNLLVTQSASDRFMHMYFDQSNNNVYVRNGTGQTIVWGSWKNITDRDWVNYGLGNPAVANTLTDFNNFTTELGNESRIFSSASSNPLNRPLTISYPSGLFVSRSTNVQSMLVFGGYGIEHGLAYRNKLSNGNFSDWVYAWTSANFNPANYVTQSSLITQLGNYATLNGVQSFTKTNTFEQNIIIPDATLINHAVNLGVLSNSIDESQGQILGYVGSNYIPLSQKGSANGVATLDASGLIPSTQLPSYVDDVIESASLATLNTLSASEKQTGKIYVTTDTNLSYRWSGTVFVEISSGAVQSVNGQTGIVNLTYSDVGASSVNHTHTIPQVTGLQSALDGKVDDSQVLTNVPAGAIFTDTIYTLPTATSTVKGGVEIFSDTVQTVASNAVSATVSRTYGIQLNSAGQAVVNVPWSDTNNTYVNGTGLSLTGATFSVNYGTTSGTSAQGNDARIINGQTAFDWGNHAGAGYAKLTSNQTFTNTNTFSKSPVIPNGTLDAHAVNVNQLNTKANGQENATAVGFSSGNIPTTDGGSFPYMYHNSGLYVALATQSYVQTNFLSTPNGTSVLISGSNLNDYLKTGFYRGSGLTNAPLDNTGWWYVVIETHESNWVTQKAISFGSGNTPNTIYQRTMAGGSWSDWAQVWTTQDFTTTNIQQWNYAYQYGLKVNETFSVNMSSGMAITDGILDNESGLTDLNEKNLVSAKRGYYYKYGSSSKEFEGLNYEYKKQKFGLGREINDTDKLTVEGSVKASKNFKSEGEKPDTLFIPNGELASLRDEIVNDQSDYAIRLDPHEYEIDPSGSLEVDDRNRLIHIIGEQVKMTVNFRRIYPKQQIVIYNFDQNGGTMTVKIQGKTIANINARGFLRLYVTKSLRVIAERQQPCDFIW